MTALGHELDADTLALWRLDDAAVGNHAQFLDEAPGARHMAAVGTPGVGPSSDRLSFCRLFDGATQYGWVAGDAASAALATGSWTVEAWMFIKALPAAGTALSLLYYGGDPAVDSLVTNTLLNIRVTDGGWLRTLWEYGAGTNVFLTQAAGTKPTVGAWCHVAISAEVSGADKIAKFYVGGALQDTQTGVNAAGGTTTPRWGLGTLNPHALLGSATDPWPWHGAIKSIRVSSVVRAAGEIAASAARTDQTHQFDASTFAHWRCTESPDVGDDGPYGFHLVKGAGTFTVADLLEDGGTGRFFDGSTYYASQDEHPLLATMLAAILGDMTVETWVRLGDEIDDDGAIFRWGFGGPEDEASNTLHCTILPTRKAQFGMEYGAGTDETWKSTADAFDAPAGHVRHHVAFTKRVLESGLARVELYIDSVLVEESGDLTNHTGATLGFPGLGYKGALTSHLFAVVDDVRVSSKRRTAAEILESYERGMGDTTDPVIEVVSPAAGSDLGENDSITVRAYDVGDGLVLVSMWMVISGRVDPVPIYLGGAFCGRFVGSTISGAGTLADPDVITFKPVNGWTRFGWEQTVRLEADVVDAAGNLVHLVAS